MFPNQKSIPLVLLVCTGISLLNFCTNKSAAQSRNIFVSISGNDKNTGLTRLDPLKTISLALALTSPGDSLYLLPGIYTERIKVKNKKGIPEKPIFIYGYTHSPDEPIIIDGGAITPSLELLDYWIRIHNSEWLEIGNIKFQNGWTDPIKLTDASYITFRNCQFNGGRKVISAIGSLTHHILVEKCSWDQGGEFLWKLDHDKNGMDAWTSMHHGSLEYYSGTLIDMKGTGGSFVIRNNTIKNAFNGIRMNALKGCDTNVEIYSNMIYNIRDNDIEPEHYAFNLYIHHNHFHNIHKTMSVDNVKGGYIYYFGNIITSDTSEWVYKICTGFWKIYGEDENLSYPMYIFNNSFCGVGKAFGKAEAKKVQLKHFNNAYFFTDNRGWQLDDIDSSNAFDFDISNQPFSSTITQKGHEQHGKIADINYVNRNTFDLHLQPESPGIDAGKIMLLPELGWVQPYLNKAPDVGAYEGDQPIDGPAFRFRSPPDIKIPYEEKPRIVKYTVNHNTIIVSFSVEINPETLSVSTIMLSKNGVRTEIKRVNFPNNKFELIIEAKDSLEHSKLDLQFSPLPKGMNGEIMTYWASVFRQ